MDLPDCTGAAQTERTSNRRPWPRLPRRSLPCEECGRKMVIKWGRNGRFLACPGYPECKNTKPLEEQEQVETDETCDLCQSPMVVKTGRYGRFLACSSYPDCKGVKPFYLGIPALRTTARAS